jgi:hypothetical protein
LWVRLGPGLSSKAMKKRMQIKAASYRAPFLYDSEAVYLRPSIASRSFAMLPNFVTDCSSGLLSDGIFTAPSSETKALTTVTGSRVGPPSPSIVAQPARRSILVAEPFPDHDVFITDPVPDQPATQSNEPGWAFFQEQHAQAIHCWFYGHGRCTITNVQQGSSSWNRVENKLQKPVPLVDTNLQKKGGFCKVTKKVKNAFIKGVKAFA